MLVPVSASKQVLVLGSFAPSLVHFRGPLIAAIGMQGHRVVAAAPAIDGETAQALKALGAEPRQVPLDNASISPAGLLRSVKAVRELIRDVRPDVVLAYTVKPVVAAALAGRAERVPKIVSLITGAGYAFTGGRELKRVVSRIAASLLYRAALKRSDVIVFQNRDDERLFRRLALVAVGRETHIVNGSGIDLRQFSPVPLPARPSFLMIARLLKDKGIREFADAAARVKAEHPKVAIALVGYLDPSPDSITEAEMDELVRRGIDFKGRLADVRPAIADCSVYVLPSYREGTPRSVLEAMAMGRAIITTDAPGCRETVIDGANGFLVPPRDADALYHAMMHFVRDPDHVPTMGRESRRIAEAKYDVTRVNQELLRLCGLADLEKQ
jgi:glycosyltransferase involved in cell wall biosynthesis